MTPAFDRNTDFSDLGRLTRRALSRSLVLLAVLFVVGAGWMLYSGTRGVGSYLLVGLSCLAGLHLWARRGAGVPLFPLLLVQHLVLFGLPLVTGNEALLPYSDDHLREIGFEVGVFAAALSAAWALASTTARPALSEAWVLADTRARGGRALAALAAGLLGALTGYSLAQELRLLDPVWEALPRGATSVASTASAMAGTCGFFVGGLLVVGRSVRPAFRAAYWAALALNLLLGTSTFLLSTATNYVLASMIGLFWGTGRFPWRLLVLVTLPLAFLHQGKFEMRERYWALGDDDPALPLPGLVTRYSEWVDASWKSLSLDGPDAEREGPRNTLVDRANNAQNLLFAIEAMQDRGIQPLRGATYAVIPPLLVPRIFWPEKPRSHEGQVQLNVHFGRQSLNATHVTYVAWGLLAEAYGNFGPFWGALWLGLALGGLSGWVEHTTRRKPLLSIEGFVTFALLVGIASSYEQVASVLVTSLFQSFIPIIGASIPFVVRVRGPRGGPS